MRKFQSVSYYSWCDFYRFETASELFCPHIFVVCITFIYFNQMFELNKGGIKLTELNRFSYFNRHLGFMIS